MEKKMKLLTLTVGLVSVVLSSQLYAADTVPCKTVKWQEDNSYKLTAKLHHAVHVVLPEQVQGDPIVGNSVLWDVDAAGQHLFIKPNSTEKEGYSTTVTAVGKSGNSYDFSLIRSTKGVSSCVRVAKGGLISNSNRSAFTRMQDPNTDYQALSGIWQKRYQSLKAQQQAEQDKAVIEAVRKYRFHI
jgi:type IV secretory pathway VirB9-like protein